MSVNQQIATLDVSVEDAIFVQILYSLHQLLEDALDLRRTKIDVPVHYPMKVVLHKFEYKVN